VGREAPAVPEASGARGRAAHGRMGQRARRR